MTSRAEVLERFDRLKVWQAAFCSRRRLGRAFLQSVEVEQTAGNVTDLPAWEKSFQQSENRCRV